MPEAPPGPRRVFCVYEQHYRRRDVADAITRGEFPIQGVTLALGLPPDWLAATLPADREWRLEWNKFYYGLDLAAAAEATRYARYARAWRLLVSSWMAQVPFDADPTDVIGRRIQNWLYAWSRFAAQGDLDADAPGFTAQLRRSLSDQLDYLERHLTRERNHRTLELYALFIGALALPDLDPGERLLRFSVGALTENLLEDVLPDGVQRERSTHYHHVVLRSFVGFRENARRFGLTVPAGFDERLARACEFALHCHRPDGGIPALSDADGGSYLDLLAIAGELLDRPDFTYVATHGRDGAAPSSRYASFPDGGYFIQRSGWGDQGMPFEQERYLIFDCGPLGDGGHGHYDALNVEIAASGKPLVVDPGRYTYCDDAPHWRRWFKGTAAHNTVTVDGLDQTPYRRGKPKGPVAQARLLQRLSGDRLDLLWGEVVSPAYDAIHRRRILFVADEYWLIEDELTAGQTHRYQLRFHLSPDAGTGTALVSSPHGAAAMSPDVAVVVAGDAIPTLEAGWTSREYARKRAAPVAVFALDHVKDASLVTVVMPLAAGEWVPHLRVRSDGGVRIADVQRSGGGVRDRIAWTADGRDGVGEGAASWRRWSGSGVLMASASLRSEHAAADTGDRATRGAEVWR